MNAADESTGARVVQLLRHAGEIATRRWRAMLIVFATVAIVIQLAAFVWPGTYAAIASLQLTRNRYPAPLTPDRAATPTLISTDISEAEVNSQLAQITSEEILARVVDEAGLDRVPERWYLRLLFAPMRAYDTLYAWFHDVPAASPRDRAIRSLRGDIRVEPLKESNVLVVTYEAGHPRYAEAVLQRVLELYVERQLHATRSQETETFFDRQAELVEQELGGYENELVALEAAAGGGGVEQARQMALALDAQLRRESLALDRQAAELDRKIAAYGEILAAKKSEKRSSTTYARNDASLQTLEAEVIRLELEQIRLEQNYKKTFPMVKENEAKLAAARRALADGKQAGLARRTTSTSPAQLQIEIDREKARADRAGIEQRRETIATQLAESRARLLDLDRRKVDSARLDRLIAITADKFALYRKSGEAARIDAALDFGRFSNVAIVQKAAAAPRPVRPKKILTLLVALLGGLLAALGTCAWLELRETGLERVLSAALPKPAEAT